MATLGSKQKLSQRRLAALNFLSNISLDGSHVDNNKLTQRKDTDGHLPNKTAAILHNIPLADTKKDLINFSGTSIQKKLDESKEARELIGDRQTKCKSPVVADTSSCGGERFRARSATYDGTQKSPRNTFINSVMKTNATVEPAVTPGVILARDVNQSSKQFLFDVEHDFLPMNTSFLQPVDLHKKISSNTSEESCSPTGNIKLIQSSHIEGSHLNEQRLVVLTNSHAPLFVYSILPFSRSKLSRGEFRGESGRRRHLSSGGRPLSSSNDYPDIYTLLGLCKPEEAQVVSYSQLLVPSYNSCRQGSCSFARCLPNEAPYRIPLVRPPSPLATIKEPKVDAEEMTQLPPLIASSAAYHPSLLDDPELIAGKHSTRIALLTFSSYMTSVIDYVKPSDLKKELNDKFREKFPHIQLTLSKLRSLKREMRKVAREDSGTDLLTVAQSYVYFEKLILRGLVHKGNRKHCAGAALLLAAKMNDVKGETLKTLIEEILNNFRISRRELFAAEFAVLVALEFSLHLPTQEIFSHYQRLLYDS